MGCGSVVVERCGASGESFVRAFVSTNDGDASWCPFTPWRRHHGACTFYPSYMLSTQNHRFGLDQTSLLALSWDHGFHVDSLVEILARTWIASTGSATSVWDGGGGDDSLLVLFSPISVIVDQG
jgi:hypothetical protein